MNLLGTIFSSFFLVISVVEDLCQNSSATLINQHLGGFVWI